MIELFSTALNSIMINKVRSFLTVLGVIIGVFSVVVLISIGRGMQLYITDQFNALGSDLLFVSPGQADFSDDPAKAFNNNKLDEKHVELIRQYASEYIVAVTPSIRVGQIFEYKTKSYSGTLTGSNELAPEILNIELSTGRYFNKSEVRSHSKVALVGNLIRKEFFNGNNPIGERLNIGEDKYEVIGVMAAKNERFDDMVIVPYTSAKETLDIDKLSSITMKVKDSAQIKKAMLTVELSLLRDLREDEFTVLSQSDVLGSIQSILSILTMALGAIAGISLLVGGIGIMNIMLVSVSERVREIGLRKALGATPTNIALQFLIESVLLSVCGGMFGLLLGWGASLIAAQFITTDIPLSAVVLAFGFSVFVGIIFGTYPALNASKKDPIEALRYE